MLAALLLAVGAEGCSGNRSEREDLPHSTAAADGAGRLLVSGGTIVRRDGPSERLDLVLRPRGKLLGVVAAAEGGRLQAADSLDITGLYVHSSHAFDATVGTGAGSIAMYIVRTGPGPGAPAKWLIGPYDVERVEPADNHPPGPPDERVGCYVLDRERWSDPTFELDPRHSPAWFPDSLRLHWLLQWRSGPEPYLVATDISGRVEGERISYFAWSPGPGDSLRVDFGFGYGGTTFRGTAKGRDQEGELLVWDHQGFEVRASARLRRLVCPDR